MRAIYLTAYFKSKNFLELPIVERPKPKVKRGECLVQVCAAGVNQSDAKGAHGFFAHAKWPRIPGRDFAGVVVEGRRVGEKVWGTGGAAGIDFDGTHAEYLALPERAISPIPENLSLLVAGAQTLPYVTAYYGLVTRARIRQGERVLVMGALGQVGRAAMSICQWKKCKPIALVKETSVEKARSMGWEVVTEVPQEVDVILNPLGDIYWEGALQKMNRFGRMVVIGAGPDPKKAVALTLLPFYRANQDLIGVNTIDLNFVESGKLLSAMRPGFESGALRPLEAGAVFPLERAAEAYRSVLEQSDQRVVITI